MKKINAAILTAALVVVVIATLPSSASTSKALDDCTCQAADGSCSVTISCRGKCIKHCGTNGDCWAECSGFYTPLGLETNLEMPYGNESQLTSLLAQTTGQDISFTKSKSGPGTTETMFTVGFKKAPLWDALEFLSDRGTVRIAGRDFESIRRLRKALLSGERLNFGVSNTPVSTFVSDLAAVTGLPLRVVAGNPMTVANVELPGANLDEMIAEVSKQTATKIVERGGDTNAR
jgi:hypothetical protein